MPKQLELLERPVYVFGQVDRLLALKPGTARRWIDGYARGENRYPPVVRMESTGSETVTWGEFVESRLLSEYRDAGIPMIRLRPAVERLREHFHPVYPLAHSRAFLEVEGRELVMRVQEEVHLERALQLVVVRSGQLVLAPQADHFVRSADFSEGGVIERLRPRADLRHVVFDPLRKSGEPVVRSVPTEVIAEQVRAGDRIEMIAELYELSTEAVEEALRYELIKAKATESAA